MDETDAYDYVIVGAGIGGCLLASHLPDGATVLLLEAGPDARTDPRVTTPSRWPELLGSELDWAYETVPQSRLDGRRLTWPRGRALGGSAAINAMVYIEGASTDYDAWTAYGGAGWSGAALRPWFPEATGAGVAALADPHPLAKAFVAAAQKYGLAANPDFNAGDQTGVGLYRVYQRAGTRWNAACDLSEAVTVWTGTEVTRVVIHTGRATAVEVVVRGETRTVHARQEILLCAGTVGSAQLLLLSGVGPADHLREVGIPVTADRPGVGANLHDHVQVSVSFPVRTAVPVDPASNLGEAGGFVRTRPGLPAPDLQLSFAPMIDLNSAGSFGAGFTIGPAVTRPVSRGRLRLATADPLEPPLLDPDYLAEEADRRVLAHGVELAFELAACEPLLSHRRDRVVRPPTGRAELDAFCRRRAETQFHPVGTCRLGRPDDPHAVVDSDLRVYGVDGLAVVDASVMPTIPTGNIAAAVHAIALKAAADRRNA
ncbi:GMC family oxidoreductase [Kitasatospora xanthocidica]|uniref:GMC family oxidoreductase n=1 Tax=Kitasatospora xanthocidica TaxID=83382 RepID=UPI0036E7D915